MTCSATKTIVIVFKLEPFFEKHIHFYKLKLKFFPFTGVKNIFIISTKPR